MSQPRVLIISQRDRADGFGRQPGYIPFLEAEDVLAQCTEADMVMVKQGLDHTSVRLRRLANNLQRQIIGAPRSRVTPPALFDLPGPGTTSGHVELGRNGLATSHYDVTVFVALTPWDLPLLRSALKSVSTDRVIVWFPELWSSSLSDRRITREPFEAVDAIFVGMAASSRRLADLTEIPTSYLPMAVDVERFTGLERNTHRPLDVMAIGRRHAKLHEILLGWARQHGRMYLYDTISGAKVQNPSEHRENLAETYRRANVAITNFAKFDQPSICGDEREIPGRLWEAMASGTLMTGLAPDGDIQRAAVGQQVVLPIPENTDSAVLQIERLVTSDTSAERRYLMDLAARNHDWAHRWSTALHSVGVPPHDGLEQRIGLLGELASR